MKMWRVRLPRGNTEWISHLGAPGVIIVKIFYNAETLRGAGRTSGFLLLL